MFAGDARDGVIAIRFDTGRSCGGPAILQGGLSLVTRSIHFRDEAHLIEIHLLSLPPLDEPVQVIENHRPGLAT
jgi:hypothetical protein